MAVAQSIAKVGSWQWIKGEKHPSVSDEVFSIYETEKKPLSIEDIRSFVHPDDRARVLKQTANDFEEDFVPVIGYRIITEKGNLKHVITKAQQVKNKKGEVVQFLGTIQDITRQKIDQEQIETLSLVASETVNGVLIQDVTGKIVWSNKGFTKISGYSADEVKGRRPWAVLKGKDTNMKLADLTFEKVRSGKSFSTDNIMYTKDGDPIWITVAVSPITDHQGNITKMVTVATDISKQKELDTLQKNMLRKLEQANKELRCSKDDPAN